MRLLKEALLRLENQFVPRKMTTKVLNPIDRRVLNRFELLTMYRGRIQSGQIVKLEEKELLTLGWYSKVAVGLWLKKSKSAGRAFVMRWEAKALINVPDYWEDLTNTANKINDGKPENIPLSAYQAWCHLRLQQLREELGAKQKNQVNFILKTNPHLINRERFEEELEQVKLHFSQQKLKEAS